MDVRCARCSTEYEFDDALVSERGTTVKCTNCGHQFKVFPGGGSGAGPERWIVRKASGRELVYTSLKELQRAISQRQVGPTDMLSRGGGQPLRPLGDIAELEPFFESQPGSPAAVQNTLLGLSPLGEGRQRDDDTVRDAAPSFARTMQSQAPRTPSHGTGNVPAPRLPPRAPRAAYADDFEPKTVPRNETPAPSGDFNATMPAASNRGEDRAPPPPPVAQVARPREVAIQEAPRQPEPVLTPTPSAVSEGYRAYEEHYTDPRYVRPEKKGSAARWIVGLLLLGGMGAAAATVGRPYIEALLQRQNPAPAPSTSKPDERVSGMVESARQLFYDGDLEEAKELLDKASVLSENDPKIYAALARLEAARADVYWLSIRLDDTEEDAARRETDKKKLDARLSKVDEAVRAATAKGKDDSDVICERVDQLRLSGDVDRARALVSQLTTTSSDPETAYVLAALDLAEEAPAWPSVIDRLRTAAGAERGLGRARAALIYALARAGKVEAAKTELGILEKADDPHPLTDRLKAYVDRAEPAEGEEGETEGEEETDETGETPGTGAKAGGAPGSTTEPGDFRTLLTDASRAKASGDTTKARALYSMALEKSPGNVEAMAGLADVARVQGDSAVAAQYYDRVLAANPSYVPALMGRGDMKWSSGDRAGAVALYRRAVQQAGPGTSYGQRAQKRIDAFSGGGGPSPAEDIPQAPEPSPAPAPAPAPDTPNIDTSDLPGFN